jgi:RNA polymerase sigma-70 factor (ECF subfamily)
MNLSPKETARTDEELIALLKTDEQAAVKSIYEKYWQSLLQFAFNFVRDETDAKEIVQEAFVRMVVKEQLKGVESNLRAYLYAAVKYDCIRYLRNRFSSVELDESFQQFLTSTHKEHTAHPVFLKELEYRIEKELLDLSPRLKEIFELSRKEGLNSREISLQLGLSNQTVRNQLSQAIRILRRKLESY